MYDYEVIKIEEKMWEGSSSIEVDKLLASAEMCVVRRIERKRNREPTGLIYLMAHWKME